MYLNPCDGHGDTFFRFDSFLLQQMTAAQINADPVLVTHKYVTSNVSFRSTETGSGERAAKI